MVLPQVLLNLMLLFGSPVVGGPVISPALAGTPAANAVGNGGTPGLHNVHGHTMLHEHHGQHGHTVTFGGGGHHNVPPHLST